MYNLVKWTRNHQHKSGSSWHTTELETLYITHARYSSKTSESELSFWRRAGKCRVTRGYLCAGNITRIHLTSPSGDIRTVEDFTDFHLTMDTYKDLGTRELFILWDDPNISHSVDNGHELFRFTTYVDDEERSFTWDETTRRVVA